MSMIVLVSCKVCINLLLYIHELYNVALYLATDFSDHSSQLMTSASIILSDAV